MNHKGVLSSAFNMSLGFIPVIVSIVLCEFITQDIAIYIGTAIGLLYTYLYSKKKGAVVPNFILYISTAMLLLLTLATLIPGDHVPSGTLPLTLEVSILIPMLILYLHKKRFINHFLKQKESCSQRLYAQGAESAIVSAHIILIMGILHFIAVSITIPFAYPMGKVSNQILFTILPPTVFILCIIFNQIGIGYFNKLMSHTDYLPIVNMQGDVIGKSPTVEALNYKNSYINPVIRIAVASHGMLFLCQRSQASALDQGKADIPFECYLRYGETLTDGCKRLISNNLPEAANLQPTFSIMYHFENTVTNRLVYLFILDVDNDAILCTPRFKGSKLWQFQQIEQNLEHHYFSDCFETEYAHLKDIIGIRERYRGF